MQNRKTAHDSLERLEEDFRFPLSLNDSTSLNLVVEEAEEGEEEEGEGAPSPSTSLVPDQRCIDCIKADNAVNQRAQLSQVRFGLGR